MTINPHDNKMTDKSLIIKTYESLTKEDLENEALIITMPKDEKTVKELFNELIDLIDLINERKLRANIDVTRHNLSRALELSETIMSKNRKKKFFL